MLGIYVFFYCISTRARKRTDLASWSRAGYTSCLLTNSAIITSDENKVDQTMIDTINILLKIVFTLYNKHTRSCFAPDDHGYTVITESSCAISSNSYSGMYVKV